MNKIIEKNYNLIFDDKFKNCSTYKEIENIIDQMPAGKDKNELMWVLCDRFLGFIVSGYTEYAEKSSTDFQYYNHLVSKLKINNNWFLALSYFFKNERDKFVKQLDKVVFLKKQGFTENEFIYLFVLPIKDGFPGAWNRISDFLKRNNIDNRYIIMCEVLEKYYNTDNHDERIDILENALIKDSESSLFHELLAIEYGIKKKYRQSLSYYRCITSKWNDYTHLLYLDDIYFYQGFMADAAKNKELAIESYKKCIELHPGHPYALNNLGYVYYSLKNYLHACDCFEKCLKEKLAIKYASNNYVRTLCAMGRFKDADIFVKKSSYKISKTLLSRIDKGLSNNKPVISKDENSGSVNISRAYNKVGSKQYKSEQFSSEKLLEDELEQRIINRYNDFGLHLKMYDREKYGRQYIIEGVGRIDLLAEDNVGNIYIIELKKDAGYGDVYKQITAYIECDQIKKIAKGKKVYGIICLNGPDKKIEDLVRKDKRLMLFQYSISFSRVD